jgi:hypothetical protein
MVCRNGAWMTLNVLVVVLALNRCDVIVEFLSCSQRFKTQLFKVCTESPMSGTTRILPP